MQGLFYGNSTQLGNTGEKSVSPNLIKLSLQEKEQPLHSMHMHGDTVSCIEAAAM
jgi:hypothetical protein